MTHREKMEILKELTNLFSNEHFVLFLYDEAFERLECFREYRKYIEDVSEGMPLKKIVLDFEKDDEKAAFILKTLEESLGIGAKEIPLLIFKDEYGVIETVEGCREIEKA